MSRILSYIKHIQVVSNFKKETKISEFWIKSLKNIIINNKKDGNLTENKHSNIHNSKG